MISWLPRLLPNELKFLTSTPLSTSHCPAGPLLGNEPAGDIWSVVIESPSLSKTLAWLISVIGLGSGLSPEKNEGSLM